MAWRAVWEVACAKTGFLLPDPKKLISESCRHAPKGAIEIRDSRRGHFYEDNFLRQCLLDKIQSLCTKVSC